MNDIRVFKKSEKKKKKHSTVAILVVGHRNINNLQLNFKKTPIECRCPRALRCCVHWWSWWLRWRLYVKSSFKFKLFEE